MAARDGFRLDAGWEKFKRAVTPSRYTPVLRRHVAKATERNGLVVERRVRKEIKRGVPPTNAALTISLKGGRGKPIVGTPGADMFNSVTHIVESWNTAIVGVKRTTTRGGKEYNVAEIVHDGATVRVTQAMRTMFQVLAWASEKWRAGLPIPHLEGRAAELWALSKKKIFFPLKPSTSVIRIPTRPFIRYTFQDREVKRIVQANWEHAVNLAFKEMARR